jgi:hypothetical protein
LIKYEKKEIEHTLGSGKISGITGLGIGIS